jgi:hypothetical protein
MKRDCPERIFEQEARVWGLDVAGEGLDPDSSKLYKRQGQVMFQPKGWRNVKTDVVADNVAFEYHQAKKAGKAPKKIFVDKGGVGRGTCDRLRTLLGEGHRGRRRLRRERDRGNGVRGPAHGDVLQAGALGARRGLPARGARAAAGPDRAVDHGRGEHQQGHAAHPRVEEEDEEARAAEPRRWRPFNTAKNLLFPPGAPEMGAPTPPPPPPPDITDEAVQKARAAMVRRQLMGQGMASTFLSGSLGDLTSAPTLKQSAGGM